MYLALRKYGNDCKTLKIILVPDLCPLNPEIARFSIGFHLNVICKDFRISLGSKLVPVHYIVQSSHTRIVKKIAYNVLDSEHVSLHRHECVTEKFTALVCKILFSTRK